MRLCLLVSILALTSFIDQTQVVAFAISSRSSPLPSSIQTTVPTTPKNNIMGASPKDSILRGGAAPTNTALKTATTATAASAPKPEKKLRLLALDGIRFLLCTHIVLGHFFRFANPPAFLLKFFAQINITVGAFFALSGYVSAYTTTEVGERKASPKLISTPSQKWWLSKCMGYFPMHWLVLLLFSPMFLYADVSVLGWPKAILHGVMSATLTQAWFPMHAEVWNAPTWYLSSLTFSTAILPFSLPKIAGMDKQGLRRTGRWLFLVNLLPVLGYLYDHNTWGLVEGMTIPKLHPAFAVFNAQRFHPVFNTAEILMGIVACRLAMLDTLENKDKPLKTTWLSTAVPLAGLVGTLAIRAAGLVPDCSDLLIRSVLFTPLFLKFIMGTHRNAVAKVKDPVSSFLSSKAMVWLGGLAFPIYIVHGPIGQVFYKRIIATALWGKVLKGPEYFGAYIATVFVSAYLLQTFFLQNKAVKNWSMKKVDQLSSWM
jgi:peptidoglycan/LPS O-acetylase OafA/YrhL